jgi:hypothetical protein
MNQEHTLTHCRGDACVARLAESRPIGIHLSAPPSAPIYRCASVCIGGSHNLRDLCNLGMIPSSPPKNRDRYLFSRFHDFPSPFSVLSVSSVVKSGSLLLRFLHRCASVCIGGSIDSRLRTFPRSHVPTFPLSYPRPFVCAAALLLSVALLSGCMSAVRVIPPSQEKTPLEAALAENTRLKAQLDAETEVNHKLAYDLEVARIDLQKCQAALAQQGLAPAETVPAFRDYMPDHLILGMLTGPSNWTGGKDFDGIAAYLLVKDSEGTTMKSKGNVVYDLIDTSLRKPETVMSWAIPAEVLGSTWESLPPGFRMRLPWQGKVPWGHHVLFRVTYMDAYGHTLTAEITFVLEHKSPNAYPYSDRKGESE